MAKPTPLPRYGPADRVRTVGPRLMRARLSDVRRYEPSLLSRLRVGPPDEDDVHDMRVALRRLRAALQFLEIDRSVDLQVKRLQDALGTIRDVQVQGAWLRGHLQKSRARKGHALEEPHRQLLSRLPDGCARLLEELLRWRRLTVPLLHRSVREGLERRRIGGSHVRRELRGTLRKLERRLARFDRSSDPITAHRLRIAIKKVRYEAELLVSVWPREMSTLLQTLAPLQEEFGALHDADVRISVLEQIGDSTHPAAVGRLLKGTHRERKTLSGKAHAAIVASEAEKVLRKLERSLKKG